MGDRQTGGGSGHRPTGGLHAQTRAIRAGRADNQNALAPILWATSTFTADTVSEAHDMAIDTHSSRFYTRYGNPTVKAFEDAVADLEGTESARAFASGMGALSAIVLGLCSSGDHIVAQRQLYAGTQLLLQTACPRFGIGVTFVDGTEPGAFAEAVLPGRTVLVMAETPANPKLALVDLAAVGAIAGPDDRGRLDVRHPTGPAARGIRGGPGGALGHQGDRRAQRRHHRGGGRQRGTAGMALELRRAPRRGWPPRSTLSTPCGACAPWPCASGSRPRPPPALAEALEGHPMVEAVHYPGLASHPQHELAARQMDLSGGLVSFDLSGGHEAGRVFVEEVRVVQLATSLGGPESIVTHPASTTHVSLLPEELEAVCIGQGTVRFSAGLEHTDDVVADVIGALDRVQGIVGGAAR